MDSFLRTVGEEAQRIYFIKIFCDKLMQHMCASFDIDGITFDITWQSMMSCLLGVCCLFIIGFFLSCQSNFMEIMRLSQN